MIIPTKHENLNKSILVIGSEIISFLKSSTYSIDSLYWNVRKGNKDADLDTYLDALTFLFCIDSIELDRDILRMK